MRYATWRLNWSDPMYGTGPEEIIAGRGGRAEGVVANPEVEHGPILGYVSGDFDASGLDAWEYTEITAEQALLFAQDVDDSVTFDDTGRLIFTNFEVPE